MIYEYALEPEVVATWGSRTNYRFFIRAFGLEQGRHVSRYPKKWAKKVWDAFDGKSQKDKKRLEELLVQFKKTMIKRKDYVWDESKPTWLENALSEDKRYPFYAIFARSNPNNIDQIICEEDVDAPVCHKWDVPQGITTLRTPQEMAGSIEMMLSLCRWVKFIDPYLSIPNKRQRDALFEYFQVLGSQRPVGPPQEIEIHTRNNGASQEGLKDIYERIIPYGLKILIYQWQEKDFNQKLHNRYILTDLGGVSFQHGLDAGIEGETDDICRLGKEQYELRYKQYCNESNTFEKANDPLVLIGKFGNR